MPPSLDLVLQHPAVWRGNQYAKVAVESIPSGFAELDAQLPGGGWPRAALTEQLIAMEAAKPIPASALKILTYVAPDYPPRANERKLQGWVDVEFTVGTDGKTRNIVVTDASHEQMFRREATEAVQKWQFEPRVFMGRPIEQTSFTRIRFVL